MATVRQSIMTALDTALKTILTTNGYATNAGTNVKEWKLTPAVPANLPELQYRDKGEAISREDNEHLHELEIEIKIAVSGNTIPADLRKIIGDVYYCIGLNYNLGGKAYDCEPDGDETEIDEAGDIAGTTIIRLKAYYRTGLFDFSASRV